MTLQFVLFDLDNTLYPKTAPVMSTVAEHINTFLMNALGLTHEEAGRKRDYYNETYGTALGGLLAEETVDIEAYLEFIHAVPVTKWLHPSFELAQMLENIPLRKYIFTNASRKHAENVTTALDVRRFFEDIFDIKSVNYVSKPARHSYLTVVKKLHTEPDKCIYIDDKVSNLQEPKKMGMKTVLVDGDSRAWVDVMVDDILEVGEVIQQFISETEV